MKSPVVKRSIVVGGHKTSVSLEEAFWNGMKEISGLRNMTLSELVGEIDSNRQQGNLSSAIRLFVLDYFRTRAAAAWIQNRKARSWFDQIESDHDWSPLLEHVFPQKPVATFPDHVPRRVRG
jgi:predicted DNA-binding ribbon-helix-helix protein